MNIESLLRDSLSFLKKQKKIYLTVINSVPLEDHFQSLELGFEFLVNIFYASENEDLDYRIGCVMGNAYVELESLSDKPTNESLILDMDRAYTNLRAMMKNVIINPETGECDVMFPRLCRTVKYLFIFISYLLKSFQNFLRYKADQTSLFVEKLMFLETLLTHMTSLDEELCRVEVSVTLHALIEKLPLLIYSCLVDKLDEVMELALNHYFSDLLETDKFTNIYLSIFRVSKYHFITKYPLRRELDLVDSLVKILECDTSFVFYLNESRRELHDMLEFLRNVLKGLPRELMVEKFSYLISATEVIASLAIPIICSCYDEDAEEEMAKKVNGSIALILDQLVRIKDEVAEMKLYNYPKTDELGFLDLFMEHLEDLLNCPPKSIEILDNEIGKLHKAFDSLRTFLRKFKDQHMKHEELENHWTRTIGLAYQAEYIIDSFLVTNAPDSRTMFSINNVIEQAKLILSEVEGIDEEKYNTQAIDIAKSSTYLPSQVAGTKSEKVVVGFEDEEEKIMEYLVQGSKNRDVLSIVGMPGLGKSTLARKMYEARSTMEHFHIRAWCAVSQTYEKKKLLLSILGDVVTDINGMEKLEAEDLAEKLYKILKGRRYLIILDDIWDIKPWNDLVRSLPDDKTQSRILITSRLHDMGLQVKAGSMVHHLHPLSVDMSWELFQKKLLPKESFSKKFLDVGKQVARSCNGLPLAIVVASGVLAKLEKNIHLWEKFAQSLSSHIFSDSEAQCMTILELSYQHLPDHLKSCFLYMGAFGEDEEIPVRHLKWLWIAEGFVKQSGEKSLEDVAEGYLMDLISRSLVIATEETSQGGVKACGIHDILRDFCLSTGKKESFLQVIDAEDPRTMPLVYDQRRLSFDCNISDLTRAKPSGHSVRSVLSKRNSYEIDVSFISQNFMLLQVLDFDYIDFKYFSGIILLIHLRYLAFGTSTTHLPSSISNLRNLQYFRVKANTDRRREVADVPDSLWNMMNLRHVNITQRAFFNVQSSRLDTSCLSNNIETLSSPCFYSKEDAENLLRSLPKLRKLGCVFLECWSESNKSYQFPVMDFLGQLISLKVIFEGSLHKGKRCQFSFPSNLQKLTLSKCRLFWDDISKIGRSLPNLKVLKLDGDKWGGTWIVEWKVNDQDFQELVYLKLSNLNISVWNASEDSFPVLEKLVLENCWNLKAIPPCFGGIPTLRMITVTDCKPSVDESARRVQVEQQEEWQNEQLQVAIHPLNRNKDKMEDLRYGSYDSFGWWIWA